GCVSRFLFSSRRRHTRLVSDWSSDVWSSDLTRCRQPSGRREPSAMADSAEDALTARVALMVAYTESALRDLGPMSGNAGSLGLFQQRASQGWGSASEEMSPAQATAMFVGRLTRVPAWRSRPPWLVAQ